MFYLAGQAREPLDVELAQGQLEPAPAQARQQAVELALALRWLAKCRNLHKMLVLE